MTSLGLNELTDAFHLRQYYWRSVHWCPCKRVHVTIVVDDVTGKVTLEF